jgi:hypothetical protein
MRMLRLLGILVVMLTLSASSAFAQMAYSVSVYLDMAADESNIYGYTDTADYSSGCAHHDYFTYGYMTGPTGASNYDSAGFSHTASLPLAAGDYVHQGGLVLTCDCAGTLVWDSQPAVTTNVTAFTANYQLVQDLGNDKAVYYRCNTGSCLSLTMRRVSGMVPWPPSYMQIGVLRVAAPGGALCFGASGSVIGDCDAPIE